jgi:hypothetical protein
VGFCGHKFTIIRRIAVEVGGVGRSSERVVMAREVSMICDLAA